MEARTYPFWRREGGLEGLAGWLVSHRVPPLTATFVTDSLWFYYWYSLWPVAQDVLPVAISARSERWALVLLTVPVARGAEGALGAPSDWIPQLEEAFEREVAEPLRAEVRLEIAFVPADGVAGRLEERVGDEAVGEERGYRTLFVGDLLHDLQALLPADALERWIETPNAQFGVVAPRALLRTPDQRYLRDLILEARHGLPT
jgi:hypothetical protein